MRVVTRYVADDGEGFPTESWALEHERNCVLASEATAMFKAGSTLEAALRHMGVHHETANWFQGVTTASKFAVPHWQCRDQAGYRVCGIRHDQHVHLFGDAGAWSGPYGHWVNLSELRSYAEETRKRWGHL